jgi:D-alanyl-D-alanine carboxypeptidase/D-alanyl-D-alanine-endopeptidase (penicillin-binding protein 4)
MLRESDNGTAELLLKEVGLRHEGEGSTAAGAGTVHDVLREDAVPDGTTVADGSGLSEAARLTCRAVTALLATRSDDLFPRLPVAARDGTLARRFVDSSVAGRLRAKTGTLDGVEALAGYAENTGGVTLAFSFIINGLPRGASGRPLQDAVAEVLVGTLP